MPKATPSTAKGGKTRATPTSNSSRLATLLATAIAKDEGVLSELKSLLAEVPANTSENICVDEGKKDDGTDLSMNDCEMDGRGGPTACPISRQGPNCDTLGDVPQEVVELRNTILQASLAEKTRVAYTRFWNRFKDFVVSSTGLFLFPSSSNHVSLFVAQLFKSGLAPSTISSHLSAISYFHQIAGHEDPCNQFII